MELYSMTAFNQDIDEKECSCVDRANEISKYFILVIFFEGNPDKWIQWIQKKGSNDQVIDDLDFAYWVKEQSELDSDYLYNVRKMVEAIIEENPHLFGDFIQ